MKGTAGTADGLGCQGSGWSGNSASESRQLVRLVLRGFRVVKMPVRGPWCIAEREEVPREGTGEIMESPELEAGCRRAPRISKKVG